MGVSYRCSPREGWDKSNIFSCDAFCEAKTKFGGIGVKAFLVHGFPGETLETTRETTSLLKEIGHMIDWVSLFRFVPLPGSFVFKNAKAYGLL